MANQKEEIMLSLGEIRHGLIGSCIAQVARETGIHYNVVWRIANGVTTDPKQETMRRLSDWVALEYGK